MKNCQQVRAWLDAFADGELPPERVVEVEQHVGSCPTCGERVRFERALRGSVRRVTAAHRAPPVLRERIARAMEAERRREVQELAQRDGAGRWLPWRTIVPLAAAAGFALVWGVLQRPDVGGASASSRVKSTPSSVQAAAPTGVAAIEQMLDKLVEFHSRGAAPQVTEPSLVSEFEPEVGVPVRLPSLQDYGARWEGGSVVPVKLDRRAASLSYRLGHHRISVYVYDSSALPLRATLEPRVVRNMPVYVGMRRGYSIAAAERKGVGYAFATDMNDDESAELVAAAVLQ